MQATFGSLARLRICSRHEIGRAAGDIRHAAMVENELCSVTFCRQLDRDRKLPRQEAQVECQILFPEPSNILRKAWSARYIIRHDVKNAAKTDELFVTHGIDVSPKSALSPAGNWRSHL